MKDELFKTHQEEAFSFTPAVAGVFDDMITRSIPFYKEIIELSTNLAINYLKPNDRVYDLGSATGATLVSLARKFDGDLELIGIDNASAMIDNAVQKVGFFGVRASFTNADILDVALEPCGAVFANFTLQFIRPPSRLALAQKICDSLKNGGVFLFAEKIISPEPKLAKALIQTYHDFKKSQGYSELEIMRKREALENVLVPYTQIENEEMARNAGFSYVECVFRYANFALFIAVKQTSPKTYNEPSV